jgi:ferrochelatase
MARDMPTQRRIAVVLFNLGGPDGPKAIRPFLFNLFADPAIIGAPALIRYPLAALISWTREQTARANYALLGGASPLLAETNAQAQALRRSLTQQAPDAVIQTFVAMRYWSPLIHEAAAAVAAFKPDEIVLTPLYPQFSTTTTGSSLARWRKAYRGPGRTRLICCYPTLDGFVAAHAERIRTAWRRAGRPGEVRLLFSAHGLPQRVVDKGDPYQSQIEATATAVAAELEDILPDWAICYQSRVGPLKWLGPSTQEAIEAAASEGLGVVVAPIAFVSEHVETLVELDHDYAALADAAGAPWYVRVPALGVHGDFIEALARAVLDVAGGMRSVQPGSEHRCAACWPQCPLSVEDKPGEAKSGEDRPA